MMLKKFNNEDDLAKNLSLLILKKIKGARDEVLNPTTESFCDRRINEHYVRIAIFKDKELTTPRFTEKEFQDLTYVELGDLVQKYNEVIDVFNELNINNYN